MKFDINDGCAVDVCKWLGKSFRVVKFYKLVLLAYLVRWHSFDFLEPLHSAK